MWNTKCGFFPRLEDENSEQEEIRRGGTKTEKLETALRIRDGHLTLVLVEEMLRGNGPIMYTAGFPVKYSPARLSLYVHEGRCYLKLFTSSEHYFQSEYDELIPLRYISNIMGPMMSIKKAGKPLIYGIVINPYTDRFWMRTDYAMECLSKSIMPPEHW